MVPDDVPGEAVQAELAAFGGALGIETARTEGTYGSLVPAGAISV